MTTKARKRKGLNRGRFSRTRTSLTKMNGNMRTKKMVAPGLFARRIDSPYKAGDALYAFVNENTLIYDKFIKAGFFEKVVTGKNKFMAYVSWVNGYGTMEERARVEYPNDFYPDNVLAVTYDGTGSRAAVIFGTSDEIENILDDTREVGIDWLEDKIARGL